MAIRQTWMHYASRRNIAMAFVLGRDNELENKSLREENLMYGDMIRGHFIDSYANLTLKTISSLEWVCRHCPRMKYLLKTDDDMFINVPKLLTLLGTLTDNRTIYGRKVGNWKPVRNRWSKYYVSTAQFAGDTFPFFTTGPAYILPRNIVYALYKRSLATPYLKLEDVFTTGIVAESLGIWRVHVREMANTRTKLETCRIRSRVSVHMVQPHEQLDLWKKQLDDTIKC
ncbi:hypothetical protein KR009_000353 [Drosophila setifemur]|nr:hypothetical protein KR009_000353 [Drosophila setifemur]